MPAVGSNLNSSQSLRGGNAGSQNARNSSVAALKQLEAAKQQSSARDPQTLAKIIEEEQRKKELEKGGGGGGLRTFKNPALFVLYSLRVINEKIQELVNAFLKATALPSQTNQANPQQNPIVAIFNKVANLPKQLIQSFQNGLLNFLALPSKIGSNLTALAKTLASNFANLATLAASALANKLFKNLFGKDEDEGIEREDELEEQQNWLDRVKAFFVSDDTEHESNGRNIISHIRNIADQINRFFKR